MKKEIAGFDASKCKLTTISESAHAIRSQSIGNFSFVSIALTENFLDFKIVFNANFFHLYLFKLFIIVHTLATLDDED